MRRRFVLAISLLTLLLAFSASPALGTIHPLVESFDCANAQAFAHVPSGDPADPPGQTPGVTPGQGNNELAALLAVTSGFSDFSSPALFGHKLDGQCGKVGQ